MPNAALKGSANCLCFVPEMAFHHGNTPSMERQANPGSDFLAGLAGTWQTFDQACRYPPNLVFIGAMDVEALALAQTPWHANLAGQAVRRGAFGEILPEDEFLGLLDICDVFDLVWLEQDFAARVKGKLLAHPLLDGLVGKMKPGHPLEAIEAEVNANQALPLYFEGQMAGCCRRAHEQDPNLTAQVMLENLASKAGSVLSLLNLLEQTGLTPAEVDFVVECSEEACGDANQRCGGNMAKAIAETAGCVNASGFDIRAFCAGPVASIITSAALVAAGVRRNVVVLAGGSVPKLFMNAREHVKKGLPALESCLGSFAALIGPEDGVFPVIRLDAVGKHTVGAGASPQAVTTALAWEPLQSLGLTFADVDRYAPELHNPEITVPAGAGNVPEANAKMIAALAVMKGQLERPVIGDFVKAHGLTGFAPTQGHIPSGVPYLPHAARAIEAGTMKRAMIIGKGSLFLGRLTNLADGASFLLEAPTAAPDTQPLGADQLKEAVLEVLAELADNLRAKA